MKIFSAVVGRKCRDIAAVVIDALHISRTVEARQLIHRHRRLLADGSGELPVGIASIQREEDILENAHQFNTAPCGYCPGSFERG
ncbi:MAG: hypothetical protein ABJA75_13515 [Bradyrhizobium sp.]